MYKVELSRKALKFLDSLEAGYRKLVVSRLKSLKEDCFPRGTKKLEGFERCYRLRVGGIRIQYHLILEDGAILVYKISRRKKAYK